MGHGTSLYGTQPFPSLPFLCNALSYIHHFKVNLLANLQLCTVCCYTVRGTIPGTRYDFRTSVRVARLGDLHWLHLHANRPLPFHFLAWRLFKLLMTLLSFFAHPSFLHILLWCQCNVASLSSAVYSVSQCTQRSDRHKLTLSMGCGFGCETLLMFSRLQMATITRRLPASDEYWSQLLAARPIHFLEAVAEDCFSDAAFESF